MADAFETGLIDALPALRRYALSLCRKPDVADDLVQMTVERAISARARFDPATRLEAWLFRILRNGWIDGLRRAGSRGVEVDIADMPEAAIFDGVRATEASIMLHQTEVALAGLPADQREVILLVSFEGLSYAEAAEVLGIPKGTVMSRLARGRIALAARLGIE